MLYWRLLTRGLLLTSHYGMKFYNLKLQLELEIHITATKMPV